MADSAARRTAATEPGGRAARKPYSPPVVTEYGTLRELTRQQSFQAFDGIAGTSPAA